MSGDDADLAWANALDTALRVVARCRCVRPDDLGVDAECEVSEALAAALLSLAADGRGLRLEWDDLVAVARRELTDVDRYRAATRTFSNPTRRTP